MSANDAPMSGRTAAIAGFAASLREAYSQMEMSLRRYLLTVLVPAVVVFVLTIGVVLTFPMPLYVQLPVPLLGLLVLGAAVGYPKLRRGQRRAWINNQLHLVMTHMTVLSTTNIDRMEVFRTLAEEDEYGVAAEEIARVVQLVDTWNQSLDDACRRRAKRVPSEDLSDFFDRLAYTVGGGQGLEDFLLREQDVFISNYVTYYESSFENLEVMKDLYLSMILSMTFALVFAIVLPILTGTDPTLTVSAVIVLYFFVQSGFAYAIKTVVPYDPVWYNPEDISTRSERRLLVGLVVSVVLTIVAIFLTAAGMFGMAPEPLQSLFAPIPDPLYLALPLTPLLIPGLLFRAEEKRITGRDEAFPSFIRALGASESAKQSTTSAVLRTLRKKDFGALSPNVDDLYKRLNMRLESSMAWRYFAADTRSYLVQKFSEMYLIGRQMGGDPKQLGELISENMSEVNQLRQQRRQATVTFIGVLYGITAAATFAFFIGLEIVRILAGMSLELSTSTSALDIGQLIHTGVYNIPLIEYLLFVIVLFNALLSSLMIRTIDGGHKVNALTHFVALVWLGGLTAVVTRGVVTTFLSV